MLIDTHAHLNFQAFRKDADEIIQKSLDQNIWIVNVGSNFTTSQKAIEIANKYEQGVYATIGLHPTHLVSGEFEEEGQKMKWQVEKFEEEKYQKLLDFRTEAGKIVAIGEIGLDYHYPNFDKKLQEEQFVKQLNFAYKNNLPAIIHCRDAYDDLLKILKNLDFKIKGVVHCFGGNLEQAKELINLGLLISFTGIITFPKAEKIREVVKNIPLEKIMIETDCPYLAPVPYRGKRNEPIYVEFVAQKIAEIKNTTFEKVAEITTKNAKEFFAMN